MASVMPGHMQLGPSTLGGANSYSLAGALYQTLAHTGWPRTLDPEDPALTVPALDATGRQHKAIYTQRQEVTMLADACRSPASPSRSRVGLLQGAAGRWAN